MKIRNWLLVFFVGFMVLIDVGTVVYVTEAQTQVLESGIDRELYSVAVMANSVLPPGYHDRINGPNSVTDAEYQAIVQNFNEICSQTNLEYIWSLMVLDGKIVFTSATSPGKDAAKRDHAAFLEVHSNPELYIKAFDSMQPQYQTNNDKWGRIRAVLVPYRDASGRPYLVGASHSMQAIDAQIFQTRMNTIFISLGMLIPGIILCLWLANKITKPVAQLSAGALRIANGDFSQRLEMHGPRELVDLGQSINAMQEIMKGRRQVEDNLRVNEERLDAGLDAANSGLWDWSLVDNTVYYDERYNTMAGYEPYKFPPEFDQWQQRVHPEDVDLTLRALERGRISNQLVIARDGKEALEYLLGNGKLNGKVCEELPTLILLEIKLPLVDGLEVLRQIKGDIRTRRLPVVMLTSSDEEHDISTSYDLGVNSYIRKPVDFNQFVEAIQQLGLYWMVINEPPPVS